MSDKMPLKTFPVLETERLLLRELQPQDAPDAFQFYTDKEVMRFFDAPMTRLGEVQQSFVEHRRHFEENAAIRWGITLRGKGKVIGTCGYSRDSNGPDTCWYATLSYVLAMPYWNKGIMTEALAAIIQFGFDHYQLHRLEAHIALPNLASQRVLQKLGFHEEGLLRERFFENGRFHDEKMFSLLKTD